MGMDYSLVQRIIDGLGKILDTKPGSPDEGTYVTEQQLADWIKGQTVVSAYYYNGVMYSDALHTTPITGQAGALYIDQDNNVLYRWDGAAWDAMSDNQLRQDILDGTVVAKKAECDQNGNTIDSTYATKTEMQTADTNLNNAINQLDHRLDNLEQAHGSYDVQSYKDGDTTPSGKGKWCVVEGVEGVSRVENQLFKTSASRTIGGVTCTNVDGTLTLSGVSTSSYAEIFDNMQIVANHSYLVYFADVVNPNNLSFNVGSLNTTVKSYLGTPKVATPTNGLVSSGMGIESYSSGTDFTGISFKFFIRDLNVHFGTNDLSFLGATDSAKLATIQKDYPHLLLPSDYGTRIVDWTGNGVRAWGVNLIDASNLIADSYVESNTGIIGVYRGVKRTDYMRVKGGESYFFGGYIMANKGNTGAYFDINKNFLGAIPNDSDARPFVAPANCAYVVMNFWLTNWGDLATTAYFVPYDLPHVWSPYMESTLSLSFSGKSAGSVYDSCELNVEVEGVAKKRETTRVGSVDLATILNWVLDSDGFYRTTLDDILPPSGSSSIRLTCDKYVPISPKYSGEMGGQADNVICQSANSSGTTKSIYVKDSSGTPSGTLYYPLADPIVTLSDPIIDNTLLTEAGGRMATVQTGTVVDGSFDMGFITL